MKSRLLSGLTILFGLVFIFSAYGKITGLDLFELDLVAGNIAGWEVAFVLARLIVGLELFTGILLLLNFRLKKFTLPWVLGLLSLFSVYLFLVWSGGEESRHCNCFGPRFPLTAGESLLKNLGLIAVALCLMKYHAGTEWPRPWLVLVLTGIVSASLPFILPAPSAEAELLRTRVRPSTFHADLLYRHGQPQDPAYDIRHGQHVVAFLSSSCQGCLLTAYKLRVMKEKNPALPLLLVINGRLPGISDFWKVTGAGEIPHLILLQPRFSALAGAELPAVYLTDQGKIVAKLD